MSDDGKSLGIVNQVTAVSGAETVTFNGPVTVTVNNANNSNQPTAATTGQDSEQQSQTRIDGIEKDLHSNTKAESNFKITGNFPTLHEPISEYSPEMTKINNYFGGELLKIINTTESKSSKRIAKGEAISHEQFLDEIIRGKSKRIALVGGAGFGKTVELKKIAQKLLMHKDRNQDLPDELQFKIVHWIDLKCLQSEETTLQELLFDDVDLNENDMEYLLNWIRRNQSQVIFLFDGLDQTRFDSSISYDKIRGLKKKRSVGHLMHNLLSRNFLPDVKIVVTSREHSVSKLPEEARLELVIALTGFTQNDAENLFSEVSGGIDDQTMHNIRQLDMIKIPVYTIFTAVVHKFCNKDVPKYVSGLLAKIIEIFTKCTQMREINIRNIDILHKMMHLAYEGIKNKRFRFDEEDLKRHGLNLIDVSDMMKKVPKKNIHPGLLMEGNLVLIFCHQTLQEFLAACYISKMKFDDFKSFIEDNVKYRRSNYMDFHYRRVVIQYLYGITLNSQISFDNHVHEVLDKNRKQEILRDALRERMRQMHARVRGATFSAIEAECLVLHESNDDSLIRQLDRIVIYSPDNSNSARAISSLIGRKESMERILLRTCGITDELLRVMAENMKGSRIRVKDLRLEEHEWDVSCTTLNFFLSHLEVDELSMFAFPLDYHKEFPIFQNVKTLKTHHFIVTNEHDRVLFLQSGFSAQFNKTEKLLKLNIKGKTTVRDFVYYAVRLQNTCAPGEVQVTAKDRCTIELKDLNAMLDSKWDIDGKNMDLQVKLDDLKLDEVVTTCSNIREACSRWSVRSLEVTLRVESQEFLQKFKDEIGVAKIHQLKFLGYNSHIFSDDDAKITSLIVAQYQVERLEIINMKSLKPEHLKSILKNCQLKSLRCSQGQDKSPPKPFFFPLLEFNEIQDAARLSDTKLKGTKPE